MASIIRLRSALSIANPILRESLGLWSPEGQVPQIIADSFRSSCDGLQNSSQDEFRANYSPTQSAHRLVRSRSRKGQKQGLDRVPVCRPNPAFCGNELCNMARPVCWLIAAMVSFAPAARATNPDGGSAPEFASSRPGRCEPFADELVTQLAAVTGYDPKSAAKPILISGAHDPQIKGASFEQADQEGPQPICLAPQS